MKVLDLNVPQAVCDDLGLPNIRTLRRISTCDSGPHILTYLSVMIQWFPNIRNLIEVAITADV